MTKSGKDLPAPDSYALVASDAKPVAAPVLDYAPPMPRDRSVAIGLIGAEARCSLPGKTASRRSIGRAAI